MEKIKDSLKRVLSKEIIDKDTILELMLLEIEKYKLSDYVKNIEFTDLKGCLGIYTDDGIIKLDIDKIINQDFIKNGAFVYKLELLLNIVYHELEHVKQNKFFLEYPNRFLDITGSKEYGRYLSIKYSLLIQDNFNEYYFKHQYVPIEHEANYWGIYKSLELITSLSSELYDKYNRRVSFNPDCYLSFKDYILLSKLLVGYEQSLIRRKVISPSQRFSGKILDKKEKEYFLFENKLDDFNRLLLGLPLDKNIYLDLKKGFNDPNFNMDTCIKKLKRH